MLQRSSTSGSWLVENTWWGPMRSNNGGDLTNGRQVRNEIAVLKRVSMGHRNILTLVDYFETMNNRTHQGHTRAKHG
jgi:hypothetical protein